ncbi:MAG: saccharopine dehydrogenase NADP-binding domain-containing protein [Myxococcales bacterium]|nr:saccharopine dehydrogenase NADP-binding domain-containing protein [Myxococcales bacterium]
MPARPFDLVLFGATGFMGRLVAERILATAPAGLTWAIAGRDPRKLMDVKMALVGADRRAASVGLITADARSPESLALLAEQTHVLASTVGPFALWGEAVVAACVQQRTHYLDIAAEPAFVRNVAHLFDRDARRRGVTLVCCCGFDAVPADVGTHHVVQQLDEGPRRVLAYLRTRTHPTGGSWASQLAVVAGSGRRPPGSLPRRGNEPSMHRAPEEASGGYALPLHSVDPTVVRCTARSLASVYGGDFVYGHYLRMASKRRIATALAGRGAMAVAARMPFGTRTLRRSLPAGEGPSDADRQHAYFDLTLVGTTPSQRVITRISGGDPGTTVTSEIFAACAQRLADRQGTAPGRTGLLTPMLAFGDALPPMLAELGMPITTLSLT